MINLVENRKLYVVKPTIPSGTEKIDYSVYVDNVLVFVGSSKYFGGDYEVDLSDFIESKILSYPVSEEAMGGASSIIIRVVFSYDNGTTETKYGSYEPYIISSAVIPEPAYFSSATYIRLGNSQVWGEGPDPTDPTQTIMYHLKIPVKTYNGYVVGKTINNIEKTTYIDRNGNSHNGGVVNNYEIECYLDSDALNVTSKNNDMIYEKVIMALQSAGVFWLSLGEGVNIKGLDRDNYGNNRLDLLGRVKDIEKVELYSTYSTTNKVPSLKITFEIYN